MKPILKDFQNFNRLTDGETNRPTDEQSDKHTDILDHKNKKLLLLTCSRKISDYCNKSHKISYLSSSAAAIAKAWTWSHGYKLWFIWNHYHVCSKDLSFEIYISKCTAMKLLQLIPFVCTIIIHTFCMDHCMLQNNINIVRYIDYNNIH